MFLSAWQALCQSEMSLLTLLSTIKIWIHY